MSESEETPWHLEPTKRLRDEFALIVLPHCIEQHKRSYGHLFPDLVERATREAYALAKVMLKERGE